MKMTTITVRCDFCDKELYLEENTNKRFHKPYISVDTIEDNERRPLLYNGVFCDINCLKSLIDLKKIIDWVRTDKIKVIKEQLAILEKQEEELGEKIRMSKEADILKNKAKELDEEADKLNPFKKNL